MPMNDADLDKVIFLLSRDRLSKFIEQAGSEREGIELHQEALSLNASLFKLISTIEIALRNTVHQNLESYFGVSDWLLNSPSHFKWAFDEKRGIDDKALIKQAVRYAQRAEKKKRTQAEIAALDSKKMCITHKQIMTELPFSFWKRLYSKDYEDTLWNTTLKKTFPNKKLDRAEVANKIEAINIARDRIAHHELVLYERYNDTLKAIEFITRNLGSKIASISTPFSKFIEDDLRNLKYKAVGLHKRLTNPRRA